MTHSQGTEQGQGHLHVWLAHKLRDADPGQDAEGHEHLGRLLHPAGLLHHPAGDRGANEAGPFKKVA